MLMAAVVPENSVFEASNNASACICNSKCISTLVCIHYKRFSDFSALIN